MAVDMKKVIAGAFYRLLETRSIDKITVKMLIEECGISRQTFYYHFHDIMEVLEWMFLQSAKRLTERSLDAANLDEVLRIHIEFTEKNYQKLRRLMESRKRAQVEEMLVEAVCVYLKELAKHLPAGRNISYADMEVMLRFHACGMVGVLLRYAGNPETDREELVRQLKLLLSGKIFPNR